MSHEAMSQEAMPQQALFDSNDQEYLINTVNMEMPFGKYAGVRLLHLPEPYLVWFHQKGFPAGKLGEQLALIYEIKLNGLEKMLAPLLK